LRKEGKIVVVTMGGAAPNIVINAIRSEYPDVCVFEEQPESRWMFLRRRAKKFGWVFAVGQLLTMIASRLGKRLTKQRVSEIAKLFSANMDLDPLIPVQNIRSINDPQSWRAINATQPDVIFCVSCRMLSAKTLAVFSVPVLNFHSGILPQYRGLFGGYWSRIQNDEANFGATVHLVDAGVDTGAVVGRAYSRPEAGDTVSTYPILKASAAQAMVIQALDNVLSGDFEPETPTEVFPQWYHPPIWTYLKNGLTRKIW